MPLLDPTCQLRRPAAKHSTPACIWEPRRCDPLGYDVPKIPALAYHLPKHHIYLGSARALTGWKCLRLLAELAGLWLKSFVERCAQTSRAHRYAWRIDQLWPTAGITDQNSAQATRALPCVHPTPQGLSVALEINRAQPSGSLGSLCFCEPCRVEPLGFKLHVRARIRQGPMSEILGGFSSTRKGQTTRKANEKKPRARTPAGSLEPCPSRRGGAIQVAREVEALARMLASESSNPKAQIIVRWITVHAARTWRMSVFRLLTGKSGQYGHQKHFLPDGTKEIRYASTVRKPTDAALRLARGILDGNEKPPEIIERTRPTSFVEMGKASKLIGPDGKPLQPETTPERILKLQSRYGGIVARLGSWFLYAKNAPQIATIEQATPI